MIMLLLLVQATKPVATMPDHDIEVTALAFSPDGATLVTGDVEGLLYVWRAEDGKSVKKKLTHHHKDSILSIAFRPDGQLFFVSDKEGIVRQWAAGSWSMERKVCEWHKEPASIAVHPKEPKALSGDGAGLVSLWDMNSGQRQDKSGKEHGAAVNAVAMRATEAASGDVEGNVVFWEIASGKKLRKEKGHGKPITEMRYVGDVLVSADSGGKLVVWGEKKNEIAAHTKAIVCLATDGKWLAAGTEDGTVQLRSASTWKLEKTLDAHEGAVRSVAFAKNRMATCGDDKTVKLWGE